MSEWLIEGRLVSTPCRRCGEPTLSMLSMCFESECGACLERRHAVRHVGPVPRGVARSHIPRPALELERKIEPVRTVAHDVREVRRDGIMLPSTAVRLAKARDGRLLYGAAWFCEGDAIEAGFGAFVLREALAVAWGSMGAGGFACWSRSGKSGWKAGRAFWRDGASFGYGAHSKIPATFFA